MSNLSLSIHFLFGLFIWNYASAAKVTNHICPEGEHWVKAHSQSAYTRADGTFVSGSHHQSHCQRNPPAYAVWNERLKIGIPPHWIFVGEKSKPWTDEEKEKVLEALSLLPADLVVRSVDGIYRLAVFKSNPSNPAAGNDQQISLYDEAFSPSRRLPQILAHEFAHKFYGQFSVDDKMDYARIAKWTGIEDENGKFVLVPKRSTFTEEDGRLNPEEDFSNNIEYFLFNPKVLKDKNPDIYNWINQKYGAKLRRGKVQ